MVPCLYGASLSMQPKSLSANAHVTNSDCHSDGAEEAAHECIRLRIWGFESTLAVIGTGGPPQEPVKKAKQPDAPAKYNPLVAAKTPDKACWDELIWGMLAQPPEENCLRAHEEEQEEVWRGPRGENPNGVRGASLQVQGVSVERLRLASLESESVHAPSSPERVYLRILTWTSQKSHVDLLNDRS
eukprot:1195103-Prorocentrum_minimum.AAC.4